MLLERATDPAILRGVDHENSPKKVPGADESEGEERLVKEMAVHGFPAIHRSRNFAQ